MSIHRASCHCGNIRLEYTSDKPIVTRRCACDFCTRQNGCYTSDPEGSVRIIIADEALVNRYRFGTRQADFLICAICGTFMGAVAELGTGRRMVINVNAFEDGGNYPPESVHDYDSERPEIRTGRWAERWTPVIDDE